ncbi:MAG: thiamine phosphate synthase [Campylobacter concisus]|uniref:thiamine phosphate synthase n=1 Tax=Campylobacter concisus TaxID=199 RepID=UPI000CD9C855|nr:thiamine phosphate synthase [Campylobacter concisus]MBS6285871.1 thiamine phosphate synthase [Campylobacter concisus]MDU2009828.1 thiamine phosphate synthase [Campylobacter concisus]
MAEIYAISDDILMPENLALEYAREILECGVKFFQFRSKKAVKNEKLASEILNLCEKFGAKFIVNDDVKFAKKIGAKAVHLGKDDENIKEAFEILGKDAYVGVSCYNDINLAINAAKNGASYVAFGSVFTSLTKPNAPKCGLEVVKEAKQILNLPICVIGGINETNIGSLSHVKPDLIAIISAIYKDGNIKENIKNLQKIIKANF